MSLGILGRGGPARRRPVHGLGGGALGATIPATCWDKPGFKDCNAQGWGAAEGKCRQGGQPTQLANDKYGGNIDTCKQGEADDYAYFGCVLRICPPALTASPISYGGWTWMNTTPNASVKTFQEHINQALVAQGYKPISADGRLGPSTCGAFNFVDMSKYAALFASDPFTNMRICQSFTNPTKVGASKPVANPTSAEAKALDKKFGGLPWLVADSRVPDLQVTINRALDANGFLPIKVTGMLDAPTCGAMLWLDQNTGSVFFSTWGPQGGAPCPAATAPIPKPVPVVALPAPVIAKPIVAAEPAPDSSSGMGTLGVGLLAAAIVGGVVWWKHKTGGA